MSAFTFRMEKRVRWSEVDPQQVVFNPNYLVYADIGFTEYMRAIGLPFPNPLLEESGTDIFLVRAEVDFRASARFDDLLDIGVRTARIGRSSFTVAIEIRRGDELLAGIVNIYANADAAAGRSAPLPPGIIDRILAYEATAPDRA
ncbi:MAG: acyl-CoA thioesterase [Allosphingosinicella sp.]|uniref:acyl-CoA thioesterase n=1 Tax=Allosphingosinicella sp. TaxID=2823234 RepID=UPI00393C886E